MARVKIEDIVEHLGSEFRKALISAVNDVDADADIDDRDLLRAFKNAVGRKFNTWETVPDEAVEKD